jgi:hypothetical protein
LEFSFVGKALKSIDDNLFQVHSRALSYANNL